MYVIATADEKFEIRWSRIIADSSLVDVVRSLAELNRFLNRKPAEVLILDMTLPGARNKEILKALATTRKQLRLILAGISFTPESELTALAAGAVACCSPAMPESECRKILEVVSKKGIWLSSSGIPALMEKLKHFAETSKPGGSLRQSDIPENGDIPYPGALTRREREIARLVSAGKNNKEIAADLDITERTVKAHLTSVFEKLRVRDRAQLIASLAKEKAGPDTAA